MAVCAKCGRKSCDCYTTPKFAFVTFSSPYNVCEYRIRLPDTLKRYVKLEGTFMLGGIAPGDHTRITTADTVEELNKPQPSATGVEYAIDKLTEQLNELKRDVADSIENIVPCLNRDNVDIRRIDETLKSILRRLDKLEDPHQRYD